MKLRSVTAAKSTAVALVLAVVGLSACTTKVGLAASIDGKHVTESTVSGYLTPKAQAVSQQDSNGATTTTPARSFVVSTIIYERLFEVILNRLPRNDRLSTAQLNAEIKRELAGHSSTEVAQSRGVTGYSTSFNDLLVRESVINNILGTLNQSSDVVTQAIRGLKFPVDLSARYGTWDPKTYSLNSTTYAGYPSFLKIPNTPKS